MPFSPFMEDFLLSIGKKYSYFLQKTVYFQKKHVLFNTFLGEGIWNPKLMATLLSVVRFSKFKILNRSTQKVINNQANMNLFFPCTVVNCYDVKWTVQIYKQYFIKCTLLLHCAMQCSSYNCFRLHIDCSTFSWYFRGFSTLQIFHSFLAVFNISKSSMGSKSLFIMWSSHSVRFFGCFYYFFFISTCCHSKGKDPYTILCNFGRYLRR